MWLKLKEIVSGKLIYPVSLCNTLNCLYLINFFYIKKVTYSNKIILIYSIQYINLTAPLRGKEKQLILNSDT